MRYRHAWPGVFLLVALSVLLGALLIWGDHFLSPGPTGGLSRLIRIWPAFRTAPEAPPPAPQVASVPSPPASAPAPASDLGDSSAATDSQPAARATDEAIPGKPADPIAPDVARPPALSEEPAAATVSPVTPAAMRYSLALGTFPVAEDAERIEAQLNQAGFSTVRFRQQASAKLFTVVIPEIRDTDEAQAVVERLRQEGFSQAVVLVAGDGLAVRVAQSVPLRTAVKTAEQLRGAGHDARVTAEANRAGQITLRHGNFATRQEAEATSREIARLGVPNEVIQVR
jgi:hypothetical protein